MIGRIHGILLQKEPPAMLVDVGGIGYELEAPMTTFYDLPPTGSEVTLHTHLVIREDAHLLFGFSRLSQRSLFRNLLKVNGIGPRVALAILSGMNEDEFALCISSEDVTRITKVPGIGKKTAERLIVEMRDKVEAGDVALPAVSSSTALTDPTSEAVSALMALGYKGNEASRLVRNVSGEDLTTEDIIRQALRNIAG
ncbi:MAG: Holliday junction branch migration protein RuvA [Acidiferrobacterales bacterium]|nr:Holliday junction branch migration protein RuvA [Acidiferrobacterales bacterium]